MGDSSQVSTDCAPKNHAADPDLRGLCSSGLAVRTLHLVQQYLQRRRRLVCCPSQDERNGTKWSRTLMPRSLPKSITRTRRKERRRPRLKRIDIANLRNTLKMLS